MKTKQLRESGYRPVYFFGHSNILDEVPHELWGIPNKLCDTQVEQSGR